MSNNTPSLDYGEKLKEPVRKSAKKIFERKPYEITGISVEEYIERLKERSREHGD